MNAGKPARSNDRIERLARSMLGAALLIAVTWAVLGNTVWA
jgi:hypothetical protein